MIHKRKVISVVRGILKIFTAAAAGAILLISLPQLTGIGVYTVVSGSMAPALETGDLIYVFPAAWEELKPGDMITFRAGVSATVTHRICNKDPVGKLLYTRGDANQEMDAQPVREQDLCGKVFFHIPKLGYAGVFLKRKEGRILAAVFFLWMFLLLGITKKECGRIQTG